MSRASEKQENLYDVTIWPPGYVEDSLGTSVEQDSKAKPPKSGTGDDGDGAGT